MIFTQRSESISYGDVEARHCRLLLFSPQFGQKIHRSFTRSSLFIPGGYASIFIPPRPRFAYTIGVHCRTLDFVLLFRSAICRSTIFHKMSGNKNRGGGKTMTTGRTDEIIFKRRSSFPPHPLLRSSTSSRLMESTNGRAAYMEESVVRAKCSRSLKLS